MFPTFQGPFSVLNSMTNSGAFGWTVHRLVSLVSEVKINTETIQLQFQQSAKIVNLSPLDMLPTFQGPFSVVFSMINSVAFI